MLTDTHCHLDMLKDIEGTLERAKRNQLSRIITVGIDLEGSKEAIRIAQTYDFIWATVGIHPHEANSLNREGYEQLEVLAQYPKVVAIGEIGLDFYRNLSPRDIQIESFKRQIKLAQKLAKPLIIHCRDAVLETWQVLMETNGFLCGGVWHCFSGGVELVKQCIEAGFYIGVGGIVTFSKATKLQQAVKETPIERILLETDAPFLTPVPMRGKENEPAFLRYIAQKVSIIKDMSLEELSLKTTENAKKLLNIS
jgi:TatD DNase family protein